MLSNGTNLPECYSAFYPISYAEALQRVRRGEQVLLQTPPDPDTGNVSYLTFGGRKAKGRNGLRNEIMAFSDWQTIIDVCCYAPR